MNGSHGMYFESTSARSPPSGQRHQVQTLRRQPSSRFDAYGPLPGSGIYGKDEHSNASNAPRFNDRMNATLHAGYGGYNMDGPAAWSDSNYAPGNNFASTLGSRMKPVARGRTALPSAWFAHEQAFQPPNSSYQSLGSAGLGGLPMRPDNIAVDPEDELIPTAIVIKNIPFAVKKEQLIQIMTDLRLPLPYAFNYHFDNGVFRGLAFANFTTPEETAAVIGIMNHLELQGRKLRVEYKKMLPAAERERIEREKRERRGQLEEQHRPMPVSSLHPQQSMSSLSSHFRRTSPSPVSNRNEAIDFNDPQTLNFYSELVVFQKDHSRESLVFPSTLTPPQRRLLHTIAQSMGLSHLSKGHGEQRQIHIFRSGDNNISPPTSALPGYFNDSNRRGLNRSATTDFSDVRAQESNVYGTLRGQSSGYLGLPDSPGTLAPSHGLRAAKSFADIRSFTPSPAETSASFPAGLAANLSRFADLNGSSSMNAPSVNVTAGSLGNNTLSARDEAFLNSSFGGMGLGNGFGNSTSPRGLRGVTSWDNSEQRANPGPIGGHRSSPFGNFDNSDTNRDRSILGGPNLTLRQPRGPIADRGSGFPRARTNGHRTRGSDELSSQSGVDLTQD